MPLNYDDYILESLIQQKLVSYIILNFIPKLLFD